MAIKEIKKEGVKEEVKDLKVEVKDEVKEYKEEDDDKVGNVYKFNVKMSCGGCSRSVNNRLGRLEGVLSRHVTLNPQEVLLITKSTLEKETLLTIFKTLNKEVTSSQAEHDIPLVDGEPAEYTETDKDGNPAKEAPVGSKLAVGGELAKGSTLDAERGTLVNGSKLDSEVGKLAIASEPVK